MKTQSNYQVVIIGGSYAGLSAAMALGRSLREVLIIDGGLPCNRQTPHSHNFLTQDGKAPAEISAIAKQQVLGYPTVRLIEDIVVSAKSSKTGFSIETQSGKTFEAKKLVLATGIKDLLPEIKGFSDCWGISVVHCPYCHGYELRGMRIGILASGERAFHLATLVSNLTDELKIITQDKSSFTPEQLEKLAHRKIEIIEAEVSEIEHKGGHLRRVVFNHGGHAAFEGLYAAVPFSQSDIPVSLGCELTEQGYLQVDMMGQTTVAGVYACGDSSSPMRSVANAVATGNLAGAAINGELCGAAF